MGDSYSSSLPNEIKNRVRGFPANYFGDIVPIGFIKPFENVSASPSDIPKGKYSWTEVDEPFEFYVDSSTGKSYNTLSYKFSIDAIDEDLDNIIADAQTGKKEKIYNIYIEYVYLSNERIEISDQEFALGGFEIPKTRSVSNYRIHVLNEQRFIPSANTERDIYVVVGSSGQFIFYPYYKGDVSVETLSKILTAFPEEPRFSSSVIKLLPTRSLSLWAGFGGSVDLISSFDAGSQFDNFVSLAIGGGIIGSLAQESAAFSRLISPVAYKPFNIKYAYSLVKSSSTIFDQEFVLTEEYLASNALIGNNCYIVNISLGGKDEYIVKCFCVSRNRFNFNDVEKRYIGKGVQSGSDFRDGISRSRFMDSEPVPFAVVKERAITNTFTRQVSDIYDSSGASLRRAGSVYTSIPDDYITGGECNLQIFIPLDFFNSSTSRPVYITYIKSKDPNFRQVNSHRIEAFAASAANIEASARSFLHSASFSYDSFYVKNNIKYKLTDGSFQEYGSSSLDLILPKIDFNIDFQSNTALEKGLNALKDFSQPLVNFRPTIGEVVSSIRGSNEMKTSSCYRLSQRRIYFGSSDFFLPEGVFVAASKFSDSNGNIIDGGIAYIDGFGSLNILIKGNQILDQEWWSSNFLSSGSTINGRDYMERLDVANIKYDRSIYANSIFTDYEKIGYDILLAEALESINPVSKGGVGIGIFLLDFLDVKTGGRKFKNFVQGASLSPVGASDDFSIYYIDLSEADFSGSISPNWSFNIVNISNPPLSAIGANMGRGSLIAESFSPNISPVDLSRNGRVFWEGVFGIEQNFEQLWIRSSAYESKVGFATDFFKNIGLYARYDFKKNNIRIFPVKLPSLLSYNEMNDFDSTRSNVDKDSEDYFENKIKWFGFPVDRIPFYNHGINAMSSIFGDYSNSNQNKNSIKLIKNKAKYEKKNIGSFSNPNFDLMKGVSKTFYGQASIKNDVDKRIYSVTIKCKMDKQGIQEMKKYIKKDYTVMSFSAFVQSNSSGENKKENDASAFSYFTFSGDSDIESKFYLPNYIGEISLSGPAIYFVNKYSSEQKVDILCYENSYFENFSFSSDDIYPAIDSFTNGYIGCVSNNDTTPSIDVYVTQDNHVDWKLYRNIFQSFTNDNIYQLVIKSDQKSMRIYMMFVINGSLVCKFINGVSILGLMVADQPVVSKNSFVIGYGSGVYAYGLTGYAYDSIQNVENFSNRNLSELDHKARIAPAYVVQSSYENNEFIKQEYINTIFCEKVLKLYNQKRLPSSVSFNTKFGNLTLSLSEYLNDNDKILFGPRISVGYWPPDSADEKRHWAVNEPYTFEVLNDGSFIVFILKEGSIFVLRSYDGISWTSSFYSNKIIGSRPIKWSINDQDSYINLDSFEPVYGSCPSIENISSCYDYESGRLTLFYVIENCIFGQHFYCNEIFGKQDGDMSYYLNTIDNKPGSKSRPFYVVGKMPNEMIDAGKMGLNYVSIGETNSSSYGTYGKDAKFFFNVGFGESTVNVETNGRAPGASCIGPGLIRLYYEDSFDVVRGVTIYEMYAKIDLNRKN